jgi:glutaminyl-tRNA synthetase
MIDNTKRHNFIRQMISDDKESGKHTNVITRFPPEPNGYLHIGHAKSICLNFGLAKEWQGKCYLRFDDTNPCKEEEEFIHAIIEDVKWLGFQWCDITYASDYYQIFYDCAVHLINNDLAYVDDLTMDEIRSYRGTLQEPGKNSPFRQRTKEENLDLFARMKAGEFPDGSRVLRAKIDMQSGNINLRDPVLYRIRHIAHQRTGNTWCIYPMYDFAHPISDAIENITHSLCTLEFQDHRPFYDWLIQHTSNMPNIKFGHPEQTEFARLNLSHTVTSKRKLRELVEKNHVSSWNDPRLPTLSGMRKRGYPPAAIRQFCEIIGVSRSDSVIELSLLEACVRDELNRTTKRLMCVLDPLKVVIENYPSNQTQELNVAFNPQDETSATRCVPFTQELYIDRQDFMEDPPKKYFRLAPGQEVRLRHAYVIRCNEVIKDENGNPIELRCSYDPDTLGKNPVDRKVKGVIHWVSATSAHPITILQYDRLFNDQNPVREEDFTQFLNQDSLHTTQALSEPAVADLAMHETVQFERVGYYCVSNIVDSKVTELHRVVDLKDSWGSN